MKIEYINNTCQVCKVGYGECFIYQGLTFIRLDVSLTELADVAHVHIANMSTGMLNTMDADQLVYPFEALLTTDDRGYKNASN